MADGDGRTLLNMAEEILAAVAPGQAPLDRAGLVKLVQRRAPLYDKSRDGHYNLISALHKAVRGSDPDAALYWLCRMLDGGEDRLFLARRLVRMAVEDIGLADPQALAVANAAKDAFDFLGSPEGELALAQATLYLATAPKSNAAYVAFKAAMRAAKEHGSLSSAEAHPQRTDQADGGGGLRRRAMPTTTTPRRASPARTISPTRCCAGRASTIPPSAASSARSGSASPTGRGSGRSGSRKFERRQDRRRRCVGGQGSTGRQAEATQLHAMLSIANLRPVSASQFGSLPCSHSSKAFASSRARPSLQRRSAA